MCDRKTNRWRHTNKDKMIAIILPCRNSGIILPAAIESIINNTTYSYKLIIIDGGSTDETGKIADSYAKKYQQIEVHHIENIGFISAINYGIKIADDMDVYLTQDDVIIPKLYGRDWLEVLKNISELPDCGLVTTIEGGGISGPTYLDGFQWVGTWSMYIPRKTIKRIGLFDENYNPGNGDDIDYSYRVYLSGLKIYVANFWVDHHRQSGHDISIPNDAKAAEKLKEDHARYFRRKFRLGEFK